MSKVFFLDVSKCTGCYNCQIACKDEHCGNDWRPIAAPQPEINQFWIKVNENICGSVPKVNMFYYPTMCNHCENAACIEAAKDGAVYRRDDGMVIIDPEKAKGQRQIVDACPYGSVYWNEELDIPQKCTGCSHLIDNGYKAPRCVEACPMDALLWGDEEELLDYIDGAKVLKPETGLGPKVFYRNWPGQFIAGTVYDPDEEVIIEGAKCRLVNGNRLWKTTTDGYGDFWFKDLAVGVYELVIEADGYESKVIEAVRTKECQNLGDIPLKKKNS